MNGRTGSIENTKHGVVRPDPAIGQMAAAFNGMLGLSLLLLIARAWCRRLVKRVRFKVGLTRSGMTLRIVRAMSWRLTVTLLVGIPTVLAISGDSPEHSGELAGNGIGIALVFLPILMLSIWQVARRISFGVFSATESLSGRDPRQDEPVLPEAATFHSGRLLPDYLLSGLRIRKWRPTVVEAILLTWLLLVTLLPAISGYISVRKRQALLEMSKRTASAHHLAVNEDKSLPKNGKGQQHQSNTSAVPSFNLPVLAKKITPAVTMITVVNPKGGETIATGTGFWVSTDGKLITNLHVIRNGGDACVKMTKENFPPDPFIDLGALPIAEGVLAFDEKWDLAVLKFSVTPSYHLEIGAAEAVDVGERIAVIGNPQGLEGTVTEGIVSAKREAGGPAPLLQITAQISPGSSGSPVLNARGQVVGVATAYVELSGSQGLNFAVPAEAVRDLLEKSAGAAPRSLAAVVRQLRGPLEEDEDYKAAQSAFNAKNWATSRERLGAVLQRFSDKPEVHNLVGKAWIEEVLLTPLATRGKIAMEAVAAFERQVKLQPDNGDAWLLLAFMRAEEDKKGALSALQSALKLKFEKSDFERLLLSQSKKTELGKAALMLGELRLNGASVGRLFGWQYYEVGDPKSAIAAFRASLERSAYEEDSEHAVTWADLGACFHRTDQSKPARYAFDQALRIDKEVALGMLQRAHVIRDLKLKEQLLRDLVAFRPSYVGAWKELAAVLAKTGRADEATRRINSILRSSRLANHFNNSADNALSVNAGEIIDLLSRFGLSDLDQRVSYERLWDYPLPWWEANVLSDVPNGNAQKLLTRIIERRAILLRGATTANIGARD